MVNQEQGQHALAHWQTEHLARIQTCTTLQARGSVTGVDGILLHCRVPMPRIGDLCLVQSSENSHVMAEIVGFNRDQTLLAALGPLEGIATGAAVIPLFEPHSVCVGEALLGTVLDGFGCSLSVDGAGAFAPAKAVGSRRVLREAPKATDRPLIDTPLPTGLRAIDGLLTLGEGQRVGIFAGAGCGKTTLLAELARNTPCQVIVFGLIGERGRELREFLDHELDAALRARTVLVCATSDRSSMERARAAFTATAIAEGFREQGHATLLIIDSLTRFARAQREIALATGEPIGRGGLPPSVYAMLPRLVERAGKTHAGSITALYSVLIEQDSMNDPIADEVRSLLDGHIVLSRQLAERGHYPAVDILASLSRTMRNVVGTQQLSDATQIRRLMAAYQQVELLLKLGEYQPGNDPLTDCAVDSKGWIDEFLQQPLQAPVPMDHTLDQLTQVAANVPS